MRPPIDERGQWRFASESSSGRPTATLPRSGATTTLIRDVQDKLARRPGPLHALPQEFRQPSFHRAHLSTWSPPLRGTQFIGSSPSLPPRPQVRQACNFSSVHSSAK
eukprot:171809-Pleurochrysis_carterae.AAC.1